LTSDDGTTIDRVGAALAAVAESWPADDSRHAALAQDLVEAFPTMSAVGQQWTLDFATARIRQGQSAMISAARQLVGSGLKSAAAEVRVRAVRLAMRPELSQLEPLLPLLKDAVPEVRRACVLALGPARSLIADDDLLPVLHDADSEVQRLVKTALRSRGLSERDVILGKLLTDARASERLKLLAMLRDDTEHDLGVWLRRLSHDPSPAVRAAAARAAGEAQVIQLHDRLMQMAQSDPDLTVRPIARFHLDQLQPVKPVAGQ
jgi:HEAT repeat protein